MILKILLTYETQFWEKDCLSLNPIFTHTNKQDLIDKLNKGYGLGEEWYKNLVVFSIYTHKNVVCAWIAGSGTHEALSDQQIIDGCTYVIKKMLPNVSVPNPSKMIR